MCFWTRAFLPGFSRTGSQLPGSRPLCGQEYSDHSQRGEAKKGSDIDILIEVKAKKFSLLDLVGVELELKKNLRKDVDLLTYKGIDPLLKDRIMKEEVRII